MEDAKRFIKGKVPTTEILAGLAEECGELVQASLKLRRIFIKENPTPVSEEEAIENLHEEIADVLLYIRMLDVNRDYIEDIVINKTDRWADRIKNKGV